jgi:hypothetical protein
MPFQKVGVIEWVRHTTPVKAVLVDSLSSDPSFRIRNAAALALLAPGSAGGNAAAAAAAGPVDITDSKTFAAAAEYRKIIKGDVSAKSFHDVIRFKKTQKHSRPCSIDVFSAFIY